MNANPAETQIPSSFVERRSSSVIAHLHSMEEERITAVARELHDELGGLLVGAMMDLAWVKQRLGVPGEVSEKLARAQQTLAQAIGRTRRLVEELRPSLLENVGLFAALRWYVNEACERADVTPTLGLPELQPPLNAAAAIALYRITEALLSAVLRQARAGITVNISIAADTLILKILGDRPENAAETDDAREPGELNSIAHRVRSLGGTLTAVLHERAIYGATARFPLERLAPD
jgi:signal transduction histidine kinase